MGRSMILTHEKDGSFFFLKTVTDQGVAEDGSLLFYDIFSVNSRPERAGRERGWPPGLPDRRGGSERRGHTHNACKTNKWPPWKLQLDGVTGGHGLAATG